MSRQPSILVVNGEARVRRIVHTAIRLHLPTSFVATADSLRQARVLLAAFVPTAVLIDAELPDGDGLDLVREVRANASPARTTIIVTAADDSATIRDARAAGCNVVLLKPFHLDVVVALLRSCSTK